MRHILATTALLALTAGVAAAEVTISGDARMGIISVDGDVSFTHRVRAKFTLSGESDSGFSFGASFRPSNAYEAADGEAGEVFISGAFGTLTMGDIDNAAQATVGHVDGVGLTGLSDWNEILYLGDATTSARYDYSAGGLSFSASVGQNGSDDFAVAAAYAMDGYKFSVAYEGGDWNVLGGGTDAGFPGSFNYWLVRNHVVLGADATFGSITLKGRYGKAAAIETFGPQDADLTQYALSATYSMNALAFTAFITNRSLEADNGWYDTSRAIGLGATYDLGGGASLKAGYASIERDTIDLVSPWFTESDQWDLGLAFEF